jgi:hypothetical protein
MRFMRFKSRYSLAPGNFAVGFISLLSVILLVVIAVLITTIYCHINSHAAKVSNPNEVVVTEPKRKTPLVYRPVSARDLRVSYNSNGVAADKMFKDQPVEVSGVVNRIDVISGVPFVCLDTGDPSCDVQCCFDNNSVDVLASLKKGQKVVVRGICRGRALLGNILLEECSMRP